MADIKKAPFDRVADGYDPQQVAAFAAEALGWKRDLAACRSEFRSARRALDRYESVIGAIEDVELEAASIVEDAERRAGEIVRRAEEEAARILETAEGLTDVVPAAAADQETSQVPTSGSWLTPEAESDRPDPIEEIFEPMDDGFLDPELDREARLAAAANLWKRRGVLTPPE